MFRRAFIGSHYVPKSLRRLAGLSRRRFIGGGSFSGGGLNCLNELQNRRNFFLQFRQLFVGYLKPRELC